MTPRQVALCQVSGDVVANVLIRLCGGSRLEYLELLRNDEAVLNAAGGDSIPDPMADSDYCRRFIDDAIAH